MGCYSFANHVLAHHPEVPLGFEIPSVLEAVRDGVPGRATVDATARLRRRGRRPVGHPGRHRRGERSRVAVVVVGDRAGLFGRGTVGEGNDVESLELPGVQRELVERVVATGKPVVLVVLSGRPYEIGWAVEGATAPAAVFRRSSRARRAAGRSPRCSPAGCRPSGQLPVSLPRSAGAQPYSYLHPILGGPNEITSADSTPVLPFGHGLTYTTFERSDLTVDAEVAAGDTFTASVRSATPASARAPISCSCTRRTCTPASPVRSPSCSATARVELRRARRRSSFRGADRAPGVLRPVAPPHRGAGRGRALGRVVVRRPRDVGWVRRSPGPSTSSPRRTPAW